MKKSKYESIIFDLDGTLIDSWPAVYETYLRVFKLYHPNDDSSHISKLRNNHTNYLETYKLVFKTESIDEKIIQCAEEIYIEIGINQTHLFQGVAELISLIERKNIPWGIVTTKKQEFAKQIIKNLKPLKNNNVLICYEDVKNQKPNPEGLLKACKIMNASPKHSLYIGDSLSDIKAAQNCDMNSVCATYGYIPNLDVATAWNATYYIHNMLDLVNLI